MARRVCILSRRARVADGYDPRTVRRWGLPPRAAARHWIIVVFAFVATTVDHVHVPTFAPSAIPS